MTLQTQSTEYLCELDDCLSLALDVSIKESGEYTQQEKELRRYLRASKRFVSVLLEERQ